MSPSSDHFPPVFATNRPDSGETVAHELNRLLAGVRQHLVEPPALAIATAYLNPGGFLLIADELEQAPKVRLLLGAEPDPSTTKPANLPITDEQLTLALSQHADWLAAERDLTGFTRDEDAAARRLVDWLRSEDVAGGRCVEVRRYTDGFLHGKAFIAEHPQMPAVLAGSSNFTYAGLARNAELNLGYPSTQYTYLVQEWFDHFWDASDPYPLDELYAARWEPHTPWTVFLRMLWELYGAQLNADDDANVRTLLKLTGFQREGVARMLRLLDDNGGVIVADEVGLGKTFMAGEVINRASAEQRQHVLIVAPAALRSGMWEPFLERYDFSRRVKVLSYDELRLRWNEDPEQARRELDEYALVVVDEAHNLRNPNAQRTEAVNALVGGANPKQLVLLTATPVNNTLFDLHALVSLFVRNDAAFAAAGIPSIRRYIKRAHDMDPEALSPEHLFDLLDQVAVRRTRRFIKRHYQGETIEAPDGTIETIKFPTPVLERLDYDLNETGQRLLDAVVYALDNPDDVARYQDRQRDPDRLMLARYTPGAYTLDEDLNYSYQVSNVGLLRSSLLKRLESSPIALAHTLATLIKSHESFLNALNEGWVLAGDALREWTTSDAADFDEFVAQLDDRRSTQIDPAANYHLDELRSDINDDVDLLRRLHIIADAAAHDDADLKARRLIARLRDIAEQTHTPSKDGLSATDRRKTIIFSSFADTIEDLHARVTTVIEHAGGDDALSVYQGRVAPAIFGSKSGIDQDARARTIARFAPETAGVGTGTGAYDLLFTTDVLSEGVNLQQAGRIINYDLPWNPMRVVQRHGRIDRIGSKHTRVFLDCFFPAANLDRLLRLEERLQRKLAQADAAIGTGPVLPGVNAAGEGQVFTDTRDQVRQLHDGDTSILDTGGNHAALSGEEYRQRLRAATSYSFNTEAIKALPYGSGSGFINPRSAQPGYVFCIRMGDHPKPRFRFVPVDDHWHAKIHEDGSPIVIEDTLAALIAADPERDTTARHLTGEAYDAVFDAWEVARAHVYAEWQLLADGTALLPDVPKALRDAAQLVYEHGTILGVEDQQDLLARLNTSPSARTQRSVREILNSEGPPESKVQRLGTLADQEGLQAATPPPDLPAITLADVRLVAWMAVQAGQTRRPA